MTTPPTGPSPGRLRSLVARMTRALPPRDGGPTSLSELKGSETAKAVGLAKMVANIDDEHAFMNHDRAFHDVLLQTLGNARLVQFVDSLRDQTRVRGISTVGRSRPLKEIITEHRRIFRFVKAGDADGACEAMAKHL